MTSLDNLERSTVDGLARGRMISLTSVDCFDDLNKIEAVTKQYAAQDPIFFQFVYRRVKKR